MCRNAQNYHVAVSVRFHADTATAQSHTMHFHCNNQQQVPREKLCRTLPLSLAVVQGGGEVLQQRFLPFVLSVSGSR